VGGQLQLDGQLVGEPRADELPACALSAGRLLVDKGLVGNLVDDEL
jgi:hypothetical protein